jgi:hypothetical protein
VNVIRVTERSQLAAFADSTGMRSNWHEPDERGVTAVVHGTELDNAGFWGYEFQIRAEDEPEYAPGHELWVELFRNGEPAAEVNLTDLLAWAAAVPQTCNRPHPGLED